MTTPTIGARIKAARAQLNLTQIQAATMLGHKTTSQLSKWETGDIEPGAVSIEVLERKLFSKVEKLNKENDRATKKETPVVPAPAPPPPAKPVESGVRGTPIRASSLLASVFFIARDPKVLANIADLVRSADDCGMTLKGLLALLEGK